MKQNITQIIVDKYLMDKYDIDLDILDDLVVRDRHSITEYNTNMQIDKIDITIEDNHQLMLIDNELSLISTKQFSLSLNARQVDNRTDIYCADDKITLAIDSGKIAPRLKGINIKGSKKLAVLRMILDTVGWVDHYNASGWSVFLVRWNRRLYNIGYLEDNSSASFMRQQRKDTVEDYHSAYYRKRSSGWRRPLGSIEMGTEQYGDNASGLGSVFSTEVKDQLDEALELVESTLGDDEYKVELDNLREVLYNNG